MLLSSVIRYKSCAEQRLPARRGKRAHKTEERCKTHPKDRSSLTLRLSR